MAHTAAQLARRLEDAAIGAEDHGGLFTAADEWVRAAVRYDAAAWATVDPASLLFTSCTVVGADPEPTREQRLFELEYLHEDVNRYIDLARRDQPVGGLHAATEGTPTRSRRYRELLQPMGIVDELRLCFTAGGDCWGTSTLYRFDGDAPFTDQDIATMGILATVLAEGVRLSLLRRVAGQPASLAHPALAQPPGLVSVGKDGRLTALTTAAEHWLDRFGGDGHLASAARAAASRARLHGHATGRLPVPEGGWLVLHAATLRGDDGLDRHGDAVAVIVEQAQPAQLAGLIVAALGLTPREREIVEHVLRGGSTRQIATSLGISAWTVQDHLKAVFAKAGVSSRGELAALLHSDHYRPRVQRGETPGPYGWFLDEPEGGAV